MNLPDDKDFDLAVEKAIDEIFGGAEEKTGTPVVEDDSLKTSLELEPLELETGDSSKVIDFPHIDELLEVGKKEPTKEEGLNQEDLERLAAALLSLEWELTPETCFEFLTVLEEAKQKSEPRLHQIFELMHEVGTWLRDRPEEARPEWLHFLHQGVVALNLVTLHGKEPEPYVAHLKKALDLLTQKPKSSEEKLLKDLLRQIVSDYRRLVIFDWLFGKAPRLKPWQGICQKGLKEIETLVSSLPENLRPNLTEVAQETRKKLGAQKMAKVSPPPEKPKITSPPFKEVYFCRFGEEEWAVPVSSVAYVGIFKDSWRKEITEGFPLKLLLGFWVYFSFVKLKNKLSGELAEKEEKELREMVLPVLKASASGQTLIILWRDGRGGVLIVDEAHPQLLPEEARFIPGKEPLLLVNNRKIPLFEVP